MLSSVRSLVLLALSCVFALRLFMCLFVQHDSRWKHVSFWRDVHRLHVGDMSCLRTCVCVSPVVPYIYLHINFLRVCVICVSVIQGASHNRFDHFMRTSVLEIVYILHGR